MTTTTVSYEDYKRARRGSGWQGGETVPAIQALRSLRWKPKWDVLEIGEEVDTTFPETGAWVFPATIKGVDVKVRVAMVCDEHADLPWDNGDWLGTPTTTCRYGTYYDEGEHDSYNHGFVRVVSRRERGYYTYFFDWEDWFKNDITTTRGASRQNAWLERKAVLDHAQQYLNDYLTDKWSYAIIAVTITLADDEDYVISSNAMGGVEFYGWFAKHAKDWRYVAETMDDVIHGAIYEAECELEKVAEKAEQEATKHSTIAAKIRAAIKAYKETA